MSERSAAAHNPTWLTARRLAEAIIRGRYPERSPVSQDGLMRDLDVGRPAARGAIQLLIEKRMLVSKQRVGAVVQPRAEWDVSDPDVLDWLLSQDPTGTLRLVTETREAIEPVAARYAALRIPVHLCVQLTSASEELLELGDGAHDFTAARRKAYGEADKRFHRLVLEASGNPFFASFAKPVCMVLDHRLGLVPTRAQVLGAPGPNLSNGIKPFPTHPEPVALLMHLAMASAIVNRRSDAAEAMARGILAEVSGRIRSPLVQAAIRATVRDTGLPPQYLQRMLAALQKAMDHDETEEFTR